MGWFAWSPHAVCACVHVHTCVRDCILSTLPEFLNTAGLQDAAPPALSFRYSKARYVPLSTAERRLAFMAMCPLLWKA